MTELLKIEDLTVSFRTSAGRVKALNNVDVTLDEGEVYCMVGESGAGKSTLALAVMGLLPQNSEVSDGRIMYKDIDLLRAGPEQMRDLRGREISLVFQDAQAALNPIESIGPQLEEVILEHSDISLRVANSMAQDILYEMGLPDPKRIMGQYPFALSGGMCQRVMMAMALVLRPKLLIADEPTSGLDVTIQAEILHRLKDLVKEQNSSILLITHDMGVVAAMANKVGVIYAGTVVENADAVPLFRRPRHPYTWSLLQALPRIDDPGRRIEPMPGNPPDLINLPDECPFVPRCFKAQSQCREQPKPEFREIEGRHFVACYNPVEPPALED
ncbi:MAG: ABC transporter ATP-binding protein [Chloroflexi bacterium]|nr:ABC transporter ATP-binding protein [Chloroflexota bacterium]MDA1271441.1 ABC transporter ATP-binding protein [Chloroflexota bacterium]PKB58982.1 MAG: methionine ABC transporter ATP-binding protein [SAR202 cluster bacterium Casp-Chloro-G2]